MILFKLLPVRVELIIQLMKLNEIENVTLLTSERLKVVVDKGEVTLKWTIIYGTN